MIRPTLSGIICAFSLIPLLGSGLSFLRALLRASSHDYFHYGMTNSFLVLLSGLYFPSTLIALQFTLVLTVGIYLLWTFVRLLNRPNPAGLFRILLAYSIAMGLGYTGFLYAGQESLASSTSLVKGIYLSGTVLLGIGLHVLFCKTGVIRFLTSLWSSCCKMRPILAFTTLSLLAILTFSVLLPEFVASYAENRPNVILLVVDALRADRLGVYDTNSRLTPNLDAFSRECTVFLNAEAPGPNTINSSASIFCSVYPSEHGYFDYQVKINDELVTMAELLQNEGYTTYGISTNPHVSARNGLAQGFSSFTEQTDWQDSNAEAINQMFLAWAEQHRERPFSTMLWYIDPHNPYDPPALYVEKWIPHELNHLVSERTQNPLSFELTDEEKSVAEQLYNASVNYFDAQFGNLIDRLRELDLYDNSIIIVTADHGEAFWEYRDPLGDEIVGHGQSLRAQEIDVPLMIKFPRSKYRKQLFQQVNSIEIVPTVCDYLQIRNWDRICTYHRGRSLLPLISSTAGWQDHLTFNELIASAYGPYYQRSVSDENYKLVVTYLYEDVEFDPPLMRLLDISDQEQIIDTLTRTDSLYFDLLSESIDAWIDSLEIFGEDSLILDVEEEEELQQRLKALGYIN